MAKLKKALMLAAGKSTRIAAIAGTRPKPLMPIAGEAILGRNLRWLATSGIEQVWINLHFRGDLIRAEIGDGSRYGISVSYSLEPEILGTAGAVRNLRANWGETFLVVYGDNLLRVDLEVMLACHRERSAAVTVAVFDRTQHTHTGIAGSRVRLSRSGSIAEFCEGADDSVSTLVNAGVYILEPAVVDEIPPQGFADFGKDVFPRLIEAGWPLYGHLINGYCLGIDTPMSYQRALDLIELGGVQLS